MYSTFSHKFVLNLNALSAQLAKLIVGRYMYYSTHFLTFLFPCDVSGNLRISTHDSGLHNKFTIMQCNIAEEFKFLLSPQSHFRV